MYKRKSLDFGFVILAPDYNLGRIQSTARSIRKQYPNQRFICIANKDIANVELEEIGKICPTTAGDSTITSLLNKGLEYGHKNWNMFVLEGAIIPHGAAEKYSLFIENEKDILLPIVIDYNREGIPVNLYTDFIKCSLNGLFIHQTAFAEVGPFEDSLDLPIAKMDWGMKAKEKGYTFKAVLGVKIL